MPLLFIGAGICFSTCIVVSIYKATCGLLIEYEENQLPSGKRKMSSIKKMKSKSINLKSLARTWDWNLLMLQPKCYISQNAATDYLITKQTEMETKAIEKLHEELLTYWNNQNASGMASLFTKDANVIGFDGSQMNGRLQIETELKQVFANHKTAIYVWKVEEVRFLDLKAALLRAIVGMFPPGKKEINSATNAIQSLIAIKQNDVWEISLFQNTPARFHGRQELVDAMTQELSKLI